VGVIRIRYIVYMVGIHTDDVIYCHLPLYHSSGGQIATGTHMLCLQMPIPALCMHQKCWSKNIPPPQECGNCWRPRKTLKLYPRMAHSVSAEKTEDGRILGWESKCVCV
jgi:hypothetical protein